VKSKLTGEEKFIIECTFKTKIIRVGELLEKSKNDCEASSLNSEKLLYKSIIEKVRKM